MNTTAENSGCLIILIDESTTMQSNIGMSSGGVNRKTKAESSATAINSFLNRLTDGPDFPVAVVGYCSDDDAVNVGPRWAGPLAGRDFVMTSELSGSPVRVDERVRQGAGFGAESTTVQFPIWYEPNLQGKAPQVAAFDCCHQLIEGQAAAGGTPIICHITASSSADGNPQKAVEKILEAGSGSALVCNVFLGSHDKVPVKEYPSNRQFLPPGNARSIFDRTSRLPESLVSSLRQDGVAVNDRARGLVFNAQMLQLVQFLSLIQKHTATWTTMATGGVGTADDEQPTALSTETDQDVSLTESSGPDEKLDDMHATDEEQPLVTAEGDSLGLQEDVGSPPVADNGQIPSVSPGQPAVVVLVIDRSLEDPFAAQMNNACNRLCVEANGLLEQITKEGSGSIDVGVVSYGAAEVCSTFEGPLADRIFVRDSELAENPLRIEDVVEKIDDGTGGLLEITKQKPVWVELEPSEPGSVVDAFACAAQMLEEWRQKNDGGFAPILLHLTRGGNESAELRDAATRLQEEGPVTLYHLVKPEFGHPSVFYPADAEGIENEGLQALFDVTSPLLDASNIAAENDTISADSRGIVINCKFTMLLSAITQAMVN